MSLPRAHPAQLLALLFAASALAQSPGVMQAGAPMPPPRALVKKDSVRKFYHGLTYGSEAQFNPMTEVLNEGFDMLRIENAERRLGYLHYEQAATNVWRSVTHPDGAIRHYGGVWEMASREILPLSLRPAHGQWLPNYTVHLLGSSM